MYAIGGSANPTIFSEGNYFMAPNNPSTKQVSPDNFGHDTNIYTNYLITVKPHRVNTN